MHGNQSVIPKWGQAVPPTAPGSEEGGMEGGMEDSLVNLPEDMDEKKVPVSAPLSPFVTLALTHLSDALPPSRQSVTQVIIAELNWSACFSVSQIYPAALQCCF